MSHTDLCTVDLVCAKDKTVLASLRVEVRTRIDRARSGNAYRKARVSLVGSSPAPESYEWASAFAGDGDDKADGMARDLTLLYRLGHGGGISDGWMKQEVRLKVRKGGSYRVEILAVAPVVAEPKARPRAESEDGFAAKPKAASSGGPRTDAPQGETHGSGTGFDSLFDHLWGVTPPAKPAIPVNPVWREIEAVLKRKRYACEQDVNRARKAMALLLHVEGPGGENSLDALARANAFLDREAVVFKVPAEED